MHVTHTRASWMSLTEVWCGIVERQAIGRRVFKSIKDPNTKIRTFIDDWDGHLRHFIWTEQLRRSSTRLFEQANNPLDSNGVPRYF